MYDVRPCLARLDRAVSLGASRAWPALPMNKSLGEYYHIQKHDTILTSDEQLT